MICQCGSKRFKQIIEEADNTTIYCYECEKIVIIDSLHGKSHEECLMWFKSKGKRDD